MISGWLFYVLNDVDFVVRVIDLQFVVRESFDSMGGEVIFVEDIFGFFRGFEQLDVFVVAVVDYDVIQDIKSYVLGVEGVFFRIV